MTYPPKDPIGNHPAVDWFRKTQDMIVERTILQGEGIRVAQTERGARLSVDLSGIKGGVGGGLRWRGEWNEGITQADGLGPYLKNDVVIRGGVQNADDLLNGNFGITELQSGLICSTYVALRNISVNQTAPENPNQTDNWQMLARTYFPVLTIIDRGAAATSEELAALKKITLNSVNRGGRQGNCTIDLTHIRGWNAEFREVEVCVNGATSYMMVLATPPYSTPGESAPP